MEDGKQGQQVFKIGASGEAKLLFKSPTGSNHSVNNLIKKRGKGLFACVRVKTQADYLMHRYSPGNGDRPTDQQGKYTTTTTFTAEEKISNILSTTTTSPSLQQVAIIKKII